ncbi:MAG: MBL fold metallo-hydrolase, partial [Candidatus Omnitrophota bacterium]
KDKFYLILGGFHLKDEAESDIGAVVDNLYRLGTKKIGPTHCTGETAIKIFKKKFDKNFIEAKVGQTVNI